MIRSLYAIKENDLFVYNIKMIMFSQIKYVYMMSEIIVNIYKINNQSDNLKMYQLFMWKINISDSIAY